MCRALLTILCGLSLLLCVGLSVFWVRSAWTSDWINGERGGSLPDGGEHRQHFRLTSSWDMSIRVFYSNGWKVSKGSARPSGPPPGNWRLTFGSRPPTAPGQRSPFGGFSYVQHRAAGPSTFDKDSRAISVIVPHWALVLVTALPPAIWGVLFRCRRGRRRLRKGLCPRCAYDLRVTPGRCPECGWAAHPPRGGASPAPQESRDSRPQPVAAPPTR